LACWGSGVLSATTGAVLALANPNQGKSNFRIPQPSEAWGRLAIGLP
jgi:hypothetical protein